MERSLHKQPSFKWAQYKSTRSPTKQDAIIHESPHPSPQKLEHDIPRPSTQPPPAYQSTISERTTPHRQQLTSNTSATTATPSETSSVLPNQSNRQGSARSDTSGSGNISTSSDNLKSFKVSLDDPAWKVLPAALKKYKINNDDWQNYAMFICYGSTGQFCITVRK